MQPYIGIRTSVPTLKVLHPMHNNTSAVQNGIITSMPNKGSITSKDHIHCTTTSVQSHNVNKKKYIEPIMHNNISAIAHQSIQSKLIENYTRK